MKIALAKPNDIDSIVTMYESVKQKMYADGIDQWSDLYPNRDVLAQDILQQEMYCLVSNNVICGCITLNEHQDPEYRDIIWTENLGPQLVVHRLAVNPASQGKGYASKLMDYAEQMANTKKYTAVRLDAYSQNPKALKLYEKRGYDQRPGTIWFPGRKYHFFAFEKILL